MNAGRLRHRVALQQRVTTQDAYGSPSDTWQTIAEVWAAVEPLAGRELFSAQAVQAETTGKIRLRYRADVTAATRAVFNGRIYNILAAINPEERNRELLLYTSEGVNNG